MKTIDKTNTLEEFGAHMFLQDVAITLYCRDYYGDTKKAEMFTFLLILLKYFYLTVLLIVTFYGSGYLVGYLASVFN
jgi:hypothetical protein